MAKRKKTRLGKLAPRYNFSLNPYTEFRFYRCPDCHGKTGQRKLPLFIHVEPDHFIALNFTNRYCPRCDSLIGRKDEIEHILTGLFSQYGPSVIGNDYVIIGTVEKKTWREGLYQPKQLKQILPNVHDFKSFAELRMTMAGWFPKDLEPPEMPPAPSTEWVKKRV